MSSLFVFVGVILEPHDDVIKWKHFPRYWPFVRGIHWSPVNSPLNAGILLIGPQGTIFGEIFIEIYTFSFKKTHMKMSSLKWRPFCLGLNVLSYPIHYTNAVKEVKHIEPICKWTIWMLIAIVNYAQFMARAHDVYDLIQSNLLLTWCLPGSTTRTRSARLL